MTDIETLEAPAAGDDVTDGMPTICAAVQATVVRRPDRVCRAADA